MICDTVSYEKDSSVHENLQYISGGEIVAYPATIFPFWRVILLSERESFLYTLNQGVDQRKYLK